MQARQPDAAFIDSLVQQVTQTVVTQLRPWLADQLSTQPEAPAQPDPSEALTPDQTKINALQGQIDLLQLRQEKVQKQLRNYEAEIEQLHQEKQLLEQTIQELPDLYRQKFQERIEPIRTRIQQIQQENSQLRADVYDLSYRLSQQSPAEILDHPRWQVFLPKLPQIPQPPQGFPALPRG